MADPHPLAKHPKGRNLALWGAWLQLGPLLGTTWTVIRMIRAFSILATAGSDSAAEAISWHISLALISSYLGLIPGLIGLVLLLIALFSSRYRAPWFFWFMGCYAALNLLAFPFGTILGIIILTYIISRKGEFFVSEAHAP